MKKSIIFLLFFLINIFICTSSVSANESLKLNYERNQNLIAIKEQERIEGISEIEPKYLLKVTKSTNKMVVYGKDSLGNYNIQKAEFTVSTGMSPGMTPVGTFTLGDKEEWHEWYGGGTYSPYTIPYANGLYIHGPIYDDKDFNTLMTSTVEDIGQNVTSGCIKLTPEGAKYIFDNCVTGTKLEIIN